jgi:hypothetical protein
MLAFGHGNDAHLDSAHAAGPEQGKRQSGLQARLIENVFQFNACACAEADNGACQALDLDVHAP